MASTGDFPVWSPRLLRAAYWVTRVLGPDGRDPAEARRAWVSLPLAGEVDIYELEAAEAGLLAAGLLRPSAGLQVPADSLAELCQASDPVPHELLLGLVLEAARPLWLLTACGNGGQVALELIPDEVRDALVAVIADPVRREAFLLARGRTVNARELSELGGAGEEAVADACREQLLALGAKEAALAVRRVSLISDELGFDVVAPRLDGTLRRLEVKATRSAAAEAPIFLTRNEYETGRADPDWRLVVVRVDDEHAYSVLGHLGGEQLTGLVPEDRNEMARWQVARVRLPVGVLASGLPAAA